MAAPAASAAKRAKQENAGKLASLRARLPFISQSALAAILRVAKDERLPDVTSRTAVREARDSQIDIQTPYGCLHQKRQLEGGRSIEVQHPLAMLHCVCGRSQSFSSPMRKTAQMNPPSLLSPWHLVIYSDEVSPGNHLAYQHDRKTWAWYWSFLEFDSALSDEEQLTIATLPDLI